MIIKELRKWDTPQVKSKIIEIKSSILENRFKLSQGELSNTSVIRQSKRIVAQLLTILKERNEKITFKDWKQYGELANKKENGK